MNLIPSITKPTCVTTSSATLIDNIFVRTTLPESVKAGVVVDNIGDHFILITEITYPCVTTCEAESYITRKIGAKEMNKISHIIEEINWNDKLLNKTDDEAFDDFHDALKNAIDIISPKVHKIRKVRRITPWLTDAIKNSISKDKKLHKKGLITPVMKIPQNI